MSTRREGDVVVGLRSPSTTQTSPSRRGEAGGASVWLLAVGLVVVLLAAGMAAAGAASVTRHRAEAAADFAALAAAAQALSGAAAACARATTVAAANGATLTACRLADYDAIVTVRLPMPGPLARFGAATATSRAGPA